MKLYSSNDAMAKGDLEIDYYVPIKIRFKKNDVWPRDILIYNIVKSGYYFIEFSINSQNKKIIRLTIVSLNKFKNNFKIYDFSKHAIINNPDFDLSIFELNHVITDELKCEGSICNKQLTLLFDSQDKISYVIKMDYVLFLADENNNLIGLQFLDFSDEQWMNLCKDTSLCDILEN